MKSKSISRRGVALSTKRAEDALSATVSTMPMSQSQIRLSTISRQGSTYSTAGEHLLMSQISPVEVVRPDEGDFRLDLRLDQLL